MLDAKVWWPLFPLLLLIVIVCLTCALVVAVRSTEDRRARWLQFAAFSCYLLAAVSAVASERGKSPSTVFFGDATLSAIGADTPSALAASQPAVAKRRSLGRHPSGYGSSCLDGTPMSGG